MRICLICSYASDSHLSWAKNFKLNSQHQVDLITLPGRFWKLRMQTSGMEAASIIKKENNECDLFLVTSFLNVAEFKGFLPTEYHHIPIHLYFHENQFAYPISSNDPDQRSERLQHYQFIQIKSFLSADKVYFNSNYNKQTFLQGAKQLLRQLPEKNNEMIKELDQKNTQLWYLQVPSPECRKVKSKEIILLWNHRWEEDKNPDGFIEVLRKFRQKKISFQLIITGKESKLQSYKNTLLEFNKEIIHHGNVSSRDKYLELLGLATHSIITSHHDFFGLSAIEGVLFGVKTLFPKRLVYPEHFSKETWQKISYDSIDDITEKMHHYPLEDAMRDLQKYNTFKDIDSL